VHRGQFGVRRLAAAFLPSASYVHYSILWRFSSFLSYAQRTIILVASMKRNPDSRIQPGKLARGRPGAGLALIENAKRIQEERHGRSDDR
jgi:hypothetical protein